MLGASVTAVLEQLDEEEVVLDLNRAKTEILVVAAHVLVVQVDVKELAGVDGLGNRVGEVQPGHCFVGNLRVYAAHFGMVERFDESQHRAGGRQEQVAARLVGFGLQREAQVVALVADVAEQEVQRVAEQLVAAGQVFSGVNFGALAAAPEHVRLGPELNPQVDGAHGLLDGELTHLGIVGGERAFFEDRVREEVGGGHRHLQAVVGQRPFEGGNDRVALARSRVEGDQVVVVEVDSVDAQGGELLDHALGRNHPAHGIAKRVTTRIADGPEAKREHV